MHAKDVGRFLEGLSVFLRHSRRVSETLNRQVAVGFNVVDYIRPDENRLSDILSSLLNPMGKHGQGGTFLDAFLRMAGWQGEACDPGETRVAREVATTHIHNRLRRIDVEVSFAGRAGLGIENKPWAEDQRDQVKAYCEHLQRKYSGSYLLVYLTGTGRGPSEVSIPTVDLDALTDQGKVKILHICPDLCCWLAECEAACCADRVRWFLRDLRQYLEQQHAPVEEEEEMAHEGSEQPKGPAVAGVREPA